ncbi:MAG: glycosyltransferase family 39 protein [Chloroflexi bacterium]|nr:glycosyltransferase family 39 protein [Chloroflexota bacterium]
MSARCVLGRRMASPSLLDVPVGELGQHAPGVRRKPAAAPPLWRQISPEAWLVLGLVLVALVAHGINMFDFVAATAKDDEGIYTAQAWAVLREHRLAPYTYAYDHAPAGWLLLAVWMAITGGPLAFGQALDSGRVCMLVLHLLSVVLLYRVARKLGCGPGAAATGSLFLAVSPLAIFYQRLVLLDNIMIAWLLLSLDFLLDAGNRLSRLSLSGLCFGLACLSKETALVFTPALLLLVWQRRQRHYGHFTLAGWLAPMLVVVSWYPLYALLKDELLPAGESILFVIRGNTSSGVSLTDALKWQAMRGGGGAFNLDNQFWQLVRGDWLPRDATLVFGGIAATALNIVVSALPSQRRRWSGVLGVALLALLPLAYLARGGIVFDFYVLDALPFLCLNIALALSWMLGTLPTLAEPATAVVAASALLAGYAQAGTLQPLYAQQPGLAGREAIPWIKQHLAPDSYIVTPDDLWTDLHEDGSGGPPFPNAHSHWKVAADPDIRDGVFHDDWQTVDYVILAPGLEDDFRASDDTIALDALQHAHLLKEWQHDGASLSLWKVDHTGSTEAQLLASSQSAITQHFEHDLAGAYVSADGSVLSESQAYAMLRDVWSDDRADFNRTWSWTADHLLRDDRLPAWLWSGGAVTDQSTAADADTDMALALLMAGHRWQDPALVQAGTSMVYAIWRAEVVSVAGRPVMAAGDWAKDGGSQTVAVNPSYFAPYAYRIFAEVDPQDPWNGLVDSSYDTLFQASAATLGADHSAGVPPDWVALDRTTGAIGVLSLANRADSTTYGYDAPRTYWRIALDQRWFGDGRADAYLRQAGFIRDEVARQGRPNAVYLHDGTAQSDADSTVATAGALAALSVLDPGAEHGLFASELLGQANVGPDGRADTWGNGNDLYEQAWGWFATALFADQLPDVWHAS